MSYDIENRMISAVGESYGYAPDNKRIYKSGSTEELYFYGIIGQKMGTYTKVAYGATGHFLFVVADTDLYFGGKKILSRGVVPYMDRLGSNRNGSKYFPYGQEQTATSNDKDKFGTYYRDGTTGLDYADQRYYSNTLGRFTSPDPSQSARPSDPGTWNGYSYVAGDPANRIDPRGLEWYNPIHNNCVPDDFMTAYQANIDGYYHVSNCYFPAGELPVPDSEPQVPSGLQEYIWSLHLGDIGVTSVGVIDNTFILMLDPGTLAKIQQAPPGWWRIIAGGVVIAAVGIAAFYEYMTGGKYRTPDDLKANCTYVGTTSEPSTTYRGATSYEDEYLCPDGSTWYIHTIVKNGEPVHGPHIRPYKKGAGPPDYD